MFASQRPAGLDAGPRRGWSSGPKLGLATVATLAAGSLTSLALAAGVPPTLSAVSNSTLHKGVVVDAHGRTVYMLSPETSRHLLCKSRACFALWPPVTVRSRSVRLTVGHGVQGHLSLLRRSDGKLQVTLRGMPLYRYSGDSAKDQVNGEGIKSFGGTWHAVRAAQTAAPAPMPPTTTTPTTPSYSY
jgi:predicted lipoprotein with Yx(FWY)xxD motif